MSKAAPSRVRSQTAAARLEAFYGIARKRPMAADWVRSKKPGDEFRESTRIEQKTKFASFALIRG
jgi:hypothetical protein